MKFTCSRSGEVVESKSDRLPRGWKRINGDTISADAWKSAYVVRAIVVPIASPSEIGKGSQEQWSELNRVLAECWEKSTFAANWALKRLLANDVTREPGQTKCPKMPAIYLYGERDWTGWSQSAAAVLRTVEQTYRAKRYEIVWRCSMSLPNVRYPYPYPVHNKAYALDEGPDGGVMFSFRSPSGRVSVRLRGGYKYRRQLAGVRHLIEHPELRCEASIYRRGKDIAVKIVGWFPRESRESDGTLFLRTSGTSFVTGLNAKDERLFVINGDRARRWIVRHAEARQRVAEDRKYEKRRPKRDARKFIEDAQVSAKKNRDRLTAFIDETAAQCVNHACRRRLGRIVLDDADRSFFRDFQWHRLGELLQQKCNAKGIVFERSCDVADTGTARNDVSDEVKS